MSALQAEISERKTIWDKRWGKTPPNYHNKVRFWGAKPLYNFTRAFSKSEVGVTAMESYSNICEIIYDTSKSY